MTKDTYLMLSSLSLKCGVVSLSKIILFLAGCVGYAKSYTESSDCDASWTETESEHYDGTNSSPITFLLTQPSYTADMLGKPYQCVHRFEAGTSKFVDVQVLQLNTGTAYYDERSKRCHLGSLRIFDGLGTQVWAPTELCGDYEKMHINVRRITSFNSAHIDFSVNNLTTRSAFRIKVKFVNIDPPPPEPHYGNYLDVTHREKQRGTRICDWKIPVNSCPRVCEFTTPGFPGIYPPNATCLYRLINYDTNGRVYLQLGGSHFTGKFNMRKSIDCEADYVNVYDGDSTKSVLAGTYCGTEGAEFISSGNALTVEFVSQSGGPPWDYTGFDGRILGRRLAVDEPPPGRKKARTRCSWDFDSNERQRGVIYTPDYILADRYTECLYNFSVKQSEVLEMKVIVHQTSNQCKEHLYIVDGEHSESRRLCDDAKLKAGKPLIITFNSTNPELLVRYVKSQRQTANTQPIDIHYHFRKYDIQKPSTMRQVPPQEMNVPSARASVASGSQAELTVPVVSASSFVVLVILVVICCHR